jgi:hypothetical protein
MKPGLDGLVLAPLLATVLDQELSGVRLRFHEVVHPHSGTRPPIIDDIFEAVAMKLPVKDFALGRVVAIIPFEQDVTCIVFGNEAVAAARPIINHNSLGCVNGSGKEETKSDQS